MKDEIKEILDNPKILMLSYGNYISLDDYVKLKDYITNLQEDLDYQRQAEIEYNEKHTKLMNKYKNLQEENERFKARWKDTNVIIKDDKTLIMNTNAYDYLQDYESRIEKAIEELSVSNRCINIEEVLNILKGE